MASSSCASGAVPQRPQKRAKLDGGMRIMEEKMLAPGWAEFSVSSTSGALLTPFEILEKFDDLARLICYMNATLLICLAYQEPRGIMRDMKITQLEYAWKLKEAEYIEVMVLCARWLIDGPAVHNHDFMTMLVEQLLCLLQSGLGLFADLPTELMTHVMDTVSAAALQRDMQEVLVRYGFWELLKAYRKRSIDSRMELALLRAAAVVAVHPTHRAAGYPPAHEMHEYLQGYTQNADVYLSSLAAVTQQSLRSSTLARSLEESKSKMKWALDFFKQQSSMPHVCLAHVSARCREPCPF